MSDIRGPRYLHLKKVYFFLGHLVEETAVQEENQADTLTEVTLEILDEIIEIISETRDTVKRRKIEDCRDCIEEMEKIMGENCDFCGKGRGSEIPRMALVGMDAVALFPSLTRKKTAKLVRDGIRKFEEEEVQSRKPVDLS